VKFYIPKDVIYRNSALYVMTPCILVQLPTFRDNVGTLLLTTRRHNPTDSTSDR